MQPKCERVWSGLAVAALALLLSGCDAAWITVDLGTDPPADPAISAVQANLLGLEFRKGDSTTTTLEFRDGEVVDRGQASIVLDGPVDALRQWVEAMRAQPRRWPIRAGDVVTTGTITDAWPMAPGMRFATRLSDPRLAALTLECAPS